MTYHKTISLLIFDGNPNGQMMAELSNWNGRVYKVARSALASFSDRDDAENTGVYFLLGKDTEKNDTIYVGEAERMYDRIKQHMNDKEYWADCVVVISKDNHLNKAHVKYLEHEFYQAAKSAGRFIVINSTIPTRSSVSEYDTAMLCEFIDHTKLLVNTLGYKAFDSISQPVSVAQTKEELFILKGARGAEAKGLLVADGFTVLSGSTIANEVVPSFPAGTVKTRTRLFENGTVDARFRFTRDTLFTSPSLAATIVLGRSANGRAEWQTEDGKTLKAIEESAISR